MLVCKVVEVWQDFVSEYIDKKFTYIIIIIINVFVKRHRQSYRDAVNESIRRR